MNTIGRIILTKASHLLVAIVVVGMTLGATSVKIANAATTFVVTKTADTNDGACDSDCSLREAIIAANATPGDDIITLPSGTYTLTIAGTGEDVAATGDLDIASNLTINGAGAGTTIVNGGGIDRVFHVTGAFIVTLSNLTVRGGYYFYFGDPTSKGGGIYNDGGILTLTSATIKSNTAFLGGGIYNLNGTLTISNSTISGNIGVNGGGITNDSGALTIFNSTVSGNKAEGSGAGINTSGTTNINNVTITNNTGTPPWSGGGGISGNANIKNTIIAGNTADSNPDCQGTLNSQGYNLIQYTNGCTIGGDTTGNIIGVSSSLGPLQDNGGSTLTHALLPGSPAINTGNPAVPGSGGNACEAADQRGIPRPQGISCDMGSYEAGAVTTITSETTITSDSPDPSVVGQAAVVNFTVTSASGAPTGNVTVSDGVDSCTGTVAAGTCTITLTTVGARTLTATYAGDANFNGSSDTEAHMVAAIFKLFLPLILR